MKIICNTLLIVMLSLNSVIGANIDLYDYRYSQPGKVYILAENHESAADKKRLKQVKLLASQGKLLLGLEGEFDELHLEVDNTFGLENKKIHPAVSVFTLYHWFLGSLYFQNANSHEKSLSGEPMDFSLYEKAFSLSDVLGEFSRLEGLGYFLHRSKGYHPERTLKDVALRAKYKALLESGEKNPAKFLMEFAKANTGKKNQLRKEAIGLNTPEDNLFVNWAENEEQWVAFFDFMGEYFLKNLNDSEVEEKGLGVLNVYSTMVSSKASNITKDNLTKEVGFLFTLDELFVQPLVVNLRNEYFAKSILNRKDESIRKGIPIYVGIGRAHAEGLKKILQEKGMEVAIISSHVDGGGTKLQDEL